MLFFTLLSFIIFLKGQPQASLFLLTSRHKYCILTYSTEYKQIITEDSNEIGLATFPSHNKNSVYSFTPIQSSIDPTYHYIATLLYPSTITIVIPSLGGGHSHNNFTVDHTNRRSSRGSGRKRLAVSLPKNYVHLW